MSVPGQTFGQVAQAYERFRFGYPEAVADRVLAYADGPVRTAIEIGAGPVRRPGCSPAGISQ